MRLNGAGLVMLDRHECLQLLETVNIGRVALSWRAMPLILPVHYQLDGGTIVIHTAAGTTLDRATDDVVVAFEAEGPAGAVDPTWSVVVGGVATHQSPWSASTPPERQRIEISTQEMSGRAVPAADPVHTNVTAAMARW
jgi:hypothetical protein